MICPLAIWRPVRNVDGTLLANFGLIHHVQEGLNTLYGWFDNPLSRVSAHFWVSKTGRLEQYVDTSRVAWAQMQGNYTYLSVECEGFADECDTPQQEEMLAKLYHWGHEEFGWPYQLAESPGEKGFGWHGMGGNSWGNHVGCPGEIRKAQRENILILAQTHSPAVPPKRSDNRMAICQLYSQEHRFNVDEQGNLIHRWCQGGTSQWVRETLLTGCVPDSRIDIDTDFNGQLHVYVDYPISRMGHAFFTPQAGKWVTEILV